MSKLKYPQLFNDAGLSEEFSVSAKLIFWTIRTNIPFNNWSDYATRSKNIRHACLSDGNTGHASGPTCWRPDYRWLSDGHDRVHACRTRRRYVHLRRTTGCDCNGVFLRDDRVYACRQA